MGDAGVNRATVRVQGPPRASRQAFSFIHAGMKRYDPDTNKLQKGAVKVLGNAHQLFKNPGGWLVLLTRSRRNVLRTGASRCGAREHGFVRSATRICGARGDGIKDSAGGARDSSSYSWKVTERNALGLGAHRVTAYPLL
jgi:hypothetical protein